MFFLLLNYDHTLTRMIQSEWAT